MADVGVDHAYRLTSWRVRLGALFQVCSIAIDAHREICPSLCLKRGDCWASMIGGYSGGVVTACRRVSLTSGGGPRRERWLPIIRAQLACGDVRRPQPVTLFVG